MYIEFCYYLNFIFSTEILNLHLPVTVMIKILFLLISTSKSLYKSNLNVVQDPLWNTLFEKCVKAQTKERHFYTALNVTEKTLSSVVHVKSSLLHLLRQVLTEHWPNGATKNKRHVPGVY